MAFKQFALDESTQVTVYKRKASRSLRLSIAANGQVRVSIPAWAPYRAGVEFARARREWIDQQKQTVNVLAHGQAVGKAHHLEFIADASKSKPASRVKGTQIIISHPPDMAAASEAVQNVAVLACVRALRLQAEQLLPKRLAALAEIHGFDYGNVSIKQLKGRWGSCDHKRNITLNLYLMQLSWELIDYVLLHELTHTKILRHGPDFWRSMEGVLPGVKAVRKSLKAHQPVLYG